MVVNRKVSGKAMSIPAGIMAGLGVAMLLTLAASGTMAYMVLSGSLSEQALGYGTVAVVPLSVSVGAVTAAALVKHQWIPVCVGVGAAYYLSLMGITALFFDGAYHGLGITLLLTLVGTAIACTVGMKGKGIGSRRIKKYRPR